MRTVAALVFENMAPLDLFGPIQVFNVACTPDVQRPNRPDTTRPLYRVITIGKQKGPISTGREGAGPVVVAEYNINDDVDFDILLIPGGGGTRALVTIAGSWVRLQLLVTRQRSLRLFAREPRFYPKLAF